ncbi:LysR family transcriptional regulator [Azohydromonas australica]|uniref:LysR family transcriptional regulator n=1 Tax=Azohydromonas australica TaxID=364039 RepID=UPI00041EAF13|nr:LysR family transcriptional regulator [Azohydromonas australica]
MDLRQLNYFIAVAETRHLGRAAEQLHLSQPPLSRQIQQLEEELKVKLFNRTPRGMELTQAGVALRRDARNIRSLVAQAAQRAQRAGKGQVGRLDVGVYGSATFGLVPRILTAFHARHPDVELVLHHAQTPEQLAALRCGQVHIVFERMLPDDSDIDVELVAREPVLLALSATHRLASRQQVDVSELRDETMLVGTSPSIAAMSMHLCCCHEFEPRLAPPVDNIVTAVLMAAAGMGVTFVPESMSNVHFPGITYRPLLTRVDVFMELHCFYLRREASSPLIAAMLDTARRFLKRRV